jgi:hypothetical protein
MAMRQKVSVFVQLDAARAADLASEMFLVNRGESTVGIDH